jgi:hypothetical protein
MCVDTHKHISVFMDISSMYDTFNSAYACVRMPVCGYLQTNGHTHTQTHTRIICNTNVICLYDMHYIGRDTYVQYIYKYAHMHAVH